MKAKEIMKKINETNIKVSELNGKRNELYDQYYNQLVELQNSIKALFQMNTIIVDCSKELMTVSQNGKSIIEHYKNKKEYQNISEELYNTIVKMYKDELGEPTYIYSDDEGCKCNDATDSFQYSLCSSLNTLNKF